jgi:hypothetical protein
VSSQNILKLKLLPHLFDEIAVSQFLPEGKKNSFMQ